MPSKRQALSKPLRTLYTQHVVIPALNAGIEVSGDFKKISKTIPLPVDLTKMFGKELAKLKDEEREKKILGEVQLYSKYPFPWRKSKGGLRDEFQNKAWEFLKKNRNTPFYRFETWNGETVLRYATADLMRASCVDCHNKHPESPKVGWKQGDLRGVLEVRKPVSSLAQTAQSDLQSIFWIVLASAILGLLSFGLLFINTKKLRVFASFVERNPSPIFRLNSKGEILARNDSARLILPTDGKDILHVISARMKSHIETIAESGLTVWEEITLGKKTYFLNLKGIHHLKEIDAFFIDVTQKKQLENQIEEERSKAAVTARLSSIGEMAGGIAHEVNTPLGSIVLNSDLLERGIKSKQLDKEATLKIVDKIKQLANRIAKIIKALRLYSGGDDTEAITETTMGEIIENTILLVDERIKMAGIDLQLPTDRSKETWIQCRASQIGQVLIGLLSNAYDAVIDQEKKWISIKIDDLGEKVQIDVLDSGPGVAPEIRGKIFDPFFTTKQIGKASGLGLPSAVGIVKEHGGSLFLDSKRENTCFSVILPKVSVSENDSKMQNEN